MFIAALFTVATTWKQLMCPRMGEENMLWIYSRVLVSLPERRKSYHLQQQTGTWRTYTKGNTRAAEGQILHDSPYLRCLKQSNSQKQGLQQWSQRKQGIVIQQEMSFQLWKLKNFWRSSLHCLQLTVWCIVYFKKKFFFSVYYDCSLITAKRYKLDSAKGKYT